jgi:hypothetical protein
MVPLVAWDYSAGDAPRQKPEKQNRVGGVAMAIYQPRNGAGDLAHLPARETLIDPGGIIAKSRGSGYNTGRSRAYGVEIG